MRTLKKLCVSFFCILLLCTAFPFSAFAKKGLGTNWPQVTPQPPKPYGYEWATLDHVKKVYVEGKYFIIDATATLESGKTYAEKLYISLPEEGGFRLQSKHEYQSSVEKSNAGLFEPRALRQIDLKTDSAGAKVLTGSDGTVVKYTATSGGGFHMQICNASNKNIVSLTNQQFSFAYKNGKVVRVMVDMPLTGDGKESIIGTGERFNTVNQVGQYLSLTNVGAGNWGSYSYINVPIFHSNRCYSIWFNMVYPGEADIGVNDPKKYSVIFDGDKLDFYLWAGTPVENLKKYTDLTGASGVHEDWVYSFWAGACDTAWVDPDPFSNLIELLDGYMEHYGFYPRSLGGEWSVGVSAAMMQYQRKRGIRSLGWFMPGSEMLSSSLVDNDFMGMSELPSYDNSGQLLSTGYPYPYVKSLYNKGIYRIFDSTWYDGSNPSFLQVIKNRWSSLWDFGSSGAMLDYGEKYDYYGVSYNGLSNMEMHNLNPYYIAKSHYTAWTERLGNDHVLYMRSGTAGSQKFVGNFLGDQDGEYRGFNSMIYAMISLGASGFNNYGGDMFSNGGPKYSGLTQDLRNRYVSMCTFSPYMRQHGNHLIMPWKEGATLAQNFGSYYYFRENIIPTIMSAAIDANQTARPMVQGMMFAYPYQLSLASINNQYLFCDDFLVCVVPTADAHSLRVSLPAEDTWYSLFNYDVYEGGQTITVDAPTSFMPVFLKSGSVKAIDLPDSQVLGTEMHPVDLVNEIDEYAAEEMPHASLLITPPNKTRTTNIYVKDGKSTDFQTYKYHTETYVSAPTSGNSFTLTNEKGSDRQTVLALGVTPAEIRCDGEVLKRLDHIPDYISQEFGYFVERSGLTTICLPEGWKELSFVKGDPEYDRLDVVIDDIAIQRLFDDDPYSYMAVPNNSSAPTLMLDYDEPQSIGRVVVKWTHDYYSTYDLEYSEDGETWYTILGDGETGEYDYGEHWWSKETAPADIEHTVENGAGCYDIINTDIKAQYLRFSFVSKGEGVTLPGIAALDIYPTYKDEFGEEIPIEPVDPDDEYEIIWVPEDEPWDPDGDGDLDGNDDLDNNGDDSDSTSTRRRKKVIITSYTWLIFLIIGIVILIVTAIILFILLYRRKKKKAAMSLSEDGETVDTPPDFPDTTV